MEYLYKFACEHPGWLALYIFFRRLDERNKLARGKRS